MNTSHRGKGFLRFLFLALVLLLSLGCASLIPTAPPSSGGIVPTKEATLGVISTSAPTVVRTPSLPDGVTVGVKTSTPIGSSTPTDHQATLTAVPAVQSDLEGCLTGYPYLSATAKRYMHGDSVDVGADERGELVSVEEKADGSYVVGIKGAPKDFVVPFDSRLDVQFYDKGGDPLGNHAFQEVTFKYTSLKFGEVAPLLMRLLSDSSRGDGIWILIAYENGSDSPINYALLACRK